MVNDPLDVVFETPEESLAHYLRAMPKSLIPVFEREFMRRPTTGAVDLGDSSALGDGQRSRVLSAGQGESHPAPNH